MLFRVVGKFELMTSKSSLRPWFLALSSSSSLFLVKHYLLKKTVSLPELCLSQWVERLRLWELVIYIYISKTPTCWWQWWGSTGGHFRHSVSVWCGTDSTGDVVVWQEERKWKKEIKKERDNTPNNRCVLGSDPARDKCCDVIWDGAGSTAWPACRWCDLIWSQEDALEGGGWLDQSPLFILALVFLFISPSHTCTHTNIRSLPHSLLSSSLCQSYLSYHAATHFPSLLNSFLSIQYSPLSHFLSRSCSISLSPQWAVSLSRSAEQRAWVRLQTSLQWIDKNRALVTAAGWRGGKEREEIEIRESKRGKKKGWNTRRNENRRVKRKLERVGQKGGGRARWPQGVLGAARRGFEGCQRSVSGLSATLHQYGENRLGLWHAVSYLSSKHVLLLHHNGQYNHTDLAQIVFANLSVFKG